jgi:hypothetical protein
LKFAICASRGKQPVSADKGKAMHIKTLFVCGICDAEYESKHEALECEAQGLPNYVVGVGDIVLGAAGFTWFDGDKKWIANPNVRLKTTGAQCPNGDSNCFGECCTYQFYYVVTALDVDPDSGHSARYHLATQAMIGDTGYRSGYTFNKGHIAPKKVNDPPPHVLETSKALLGLHASTLLH